MPSLGLEKSLLPQLLCILRTKLRVPQTTKCSYICWLENFDGFDTKMKGQQRSLERFWLSAWLTGQVTTSPWAESLPRAHIRWERSAAPTARPSITSLRPSKPSSVPVTHSSFHAPIVLSSRPPFKPAYIPIVFPSIGPFILTTKIFAKFPNKDGEQRRGKVARCCTPRASFT